VSAEALRAGVTKPRIVPQPGTPQGGTRRYVQTVQIAVNLAAGAFTPAPATFVIQIPSGRLRTRADVVFRPDGAELNTTPLPQSGVFAWMWSMDAWVRTQDGLLVQSNNIFQNQPAPATYETVTSVDQWRSKVVVPTGNAIIPGKLYATAAWEPAAGWDPPDGELARVFQSCRINIDQGTVVSQGG